MEVQVQTYQRRNRIYIGGNTRAVPVPGFWVAKQQYTYTIKPHVVAWLQQHGVNIKMILVSFNQVAQVKPEFVTREQLVAVLTTAQEIIQDCPTEVLEEIIADWRLALTWSAGTAEEQWHWRALLVICLEGLLGKTAPEIYPLTGQD
jgi:hypothetical protein